MHIAGGHQERKGSHTPKNGTDLHRRAPGPPFLTLGGESQHHSRTTSVVPVSINADFSNVGRL